MRTTQSIGSSPFEPITDFRAFMSDPTARVRLKEVPMSEPNTFDLIQAIKTTHAAHEAFVSVRGAVVVGGDPIPLLADANARCQDLLTAVEGLQDYLYAAIRERETLAHDDAAMAAVEVEGVRDAAE